MITICFYTPREYERLKLIADDRQNLCDTYAEWLVEFTKVMTDLEEKGFRPVSLTVDIDDLVRWCKENHLKNNGESRYKYAAEMGRIHSQSQMN